MKLTDYLAIYAAILSTLIFVWNWSLSRPRIRVKLILGSEEKDGETDFGIYVCVQNTSAHTAHLSSLSILYPYTRTRFRERLAHLIRYRRFPTNKGWVHTSLRYYDTDDGFPLSIEARKSVNVFVPEGVLRAMMSDAVSYEIRAIVQDALWRNKRSAKMEINSFFREKDSTDVRLIGLR